jgi:lipopolysaccharide transport system permease protein
VTEIRAPSGMAWPDLGEVWRFRELARFLVWRDIKVRYRQTLVGGAWAVVQPLATVMVFSLFFGRLAGLPSEGLPYPVFYFCALLPWSYFSGALNAATNVVVEHQRIITKVYFPRILLPVAPVAAGLVDFAIAFLALVAVLALYGTEPAPTVLLVPLLIGYVALTTFAAGLWFSALNAYYRDVRYALPFIIQLLMFASPVAYPASLVPERWRWLYGLNPMAGAIEWFRWAMTGAGDPPAAWLLTGAAVVLAVLLGGLLCFARIERTVADVV